MSQNHSSSTTVDSEEIDRFSKVSAGWWDEEGPFKPLHDLNPTRILFIRDALIQHFGMSSKLPLEGLRILDVGCGGGLVAEPLARLGGIVTGIDASQEAITVAEAHAVSMNLPITYRCLSAEQLVAEGATFDVVLALEIVEHVADVPIFLEMCTKLVNPKGALILSTLNRTCWSYLGAIIGAEYILRWVPQGTHDWNKFLTPAELANTLRPLGFHFDSLKGLTYAPLGRSWSLSKDLSINYLGYASRKN